VRKTNMPKTSTINTNLSSSLKSDLPVKRLIVSPVTALPFEVQIATILKWASRHESRVVCAANVHMLTEAYHQPAFATVLEEADLVTPDGMPLVWMMRLMGVREQDRVAGPDMMLALSRLAPLQNISIFFLGCEKEVLARMRERLESDFPNLQIAGMDPLPFRPLTQAEDDALIQKIHKSGAGLVFVALGCPKQEYWMAQHKGKIQAVMIGLGGAFPMFAGIHKRAPRWMQKLSLEWLYRLIQEPGRLLGRYWNSNTLFIWLALKQLLTQSSVK
jgi:N-acetylglucosaminyldiphosphoundecaprenol N-acetyl-beta-D-mannosaminyltransferase